MSAILVKTEDGVEVEVTYCDAGFPPGGSAKGLFLNTTVVWIKPKDGEWLRTKERSAMAACHAVKHSTLQSLKEQYGVKDVQVTERCSN